MNKNECKLKCNCYEYMKYQEGCGVVDQCFIDIECFFCKEYIPYGKLREETLDIEIRSLLDRANELVEIIKEHKTVGTNGINKRNNDMRQSMEVHEIKFEEDNE